MVEPGHTATERRHLVEIFEPVEAERLLPHNSASHSNALVENPFDGGDDE
nr:hypothetical protein GCM10017745_63070 [Saccharothrix mutabilis subsp. capreolus]